MPNCFIGKGTRHSFEKSDCSVIALSYALDIEYSVAHAICKKNGRIDNKGFNLRWVFNVNISKKSRQFMGRRIGYHTNKHITLQRFIKSHQEGTYIICVNHHYCCLIDGKLFNQWNKNARVKYYFYVSKKASPTMEIVREPKLNCLMS